MNKWYGNKGRGTDGLLDPATKSTHKPGDYPLGSVQSRAAARNLVTHKANDMALTKAHEAAQIDYGDDLFSHVRELNRRTLAILAQAEVLGDPRTALAAIREARGNCELLCKMIVAAETSRRESSSPESIENILQRRLENARKRMNGELNNA